MQLMIYKTVNIINEAHDITNKVTGLFPNQQNVNNKVTCSYCCLLGYLQYIAADDELSMFTFYM